MNRPVRALRVAALALGTASLPVSAQSFQGLGDLPGDAFFSSAAAVSADGSVVVGSSRSASSAHFGEAFRWTQGGGMEPLGDLPGDAFSSQALGVSADGTVVVGWSESADGGEAFRWTAEGGMVGLGDLDGGEFGSRAFAVSADGTVVVGRGTTGEVEDDDCDSESCVVAVRWTAGGEPESLGDLPGGEYGSQAFAVSTDGSAVVGSGFSDGGSTGSANEAFRWTEGGGMEPLGDLAGGVFSSEATAVSADGTIVVGNGAAEFDGFSVSVAARWTGAGLVEPVSDPADGTSEGFAVSADGTTVVGAGSNLSLRGGGEAFIWTEEDGLRSIKALLEDEYGLDLTGWDLSDATGVSADGTVIVGRGTNPQGQFEAWRAELCGAVAEWNDDAGGDFSDEENWLDLVVPGEFSSVRFDFGDVYTVSFSEDAENNRLEVRDGVDVTFGLGSNTHTLSGACADETVFVDAARLSVRAGAVRSEKATVLTGTLAEPGELYVRDAGARLHADSTLWVGDAGHGLLRVEGQGAEVVAHDRAFVGSGEGGRGTVEVESGGRFLVEAFLEVAADVGTEGDLHVSGEGSEIVLNVGGGIGSSGLATARVADGGRLSFEEPALAVALGIEATGDGALEVEGGVVEGDYLSVGYGGSGQVEVLGTGSVLVANLDVAVEGGAQGLLDIQGGGGDGALLNVRDEARIGIEGAATLRVSANGFIFGTDESGPAARFVFGVEEGGVGSFDVGEDALVTVIREVVVGERGTGVMQVLGPEGYVDVGTLRVGGSDAGAGGSGLVSVGGTGSVLKADLIVLGRGGDGTLLALPGGTVEAGGIVVYGNGLQDLGGTIDAGTIVVAPAPEPRPSRPADTLARSAAEREGVDGTGLVRVDTLLVFGEGAGVEADGLSVLAGGVVGGTGPFPFGFTNGGIVAPNDTASATATFRLVGDYVQAAEGVLEAEFGGTAEGAHDRLAVSGTATLGGTLRLVRSSGYVPEVGDAYEVVAAASIDGTFESLEAPPDVELEVSYTETGVVATVTGVTVDGEGGPDDEAAPTSFALEPAYPNPFAGRATVGYALPEAADVRLVVYDVLGRQVATLADGPVEAGRHEATFDAAALPSGTYLVRMTTDGGFAQTQRITVLR